MINVTFNLRMPQELYNELAKQAEKEMTTRATIVRKAIKRYIRGEGVNE